MKRGIAVACWVMAFAWGAVGCSSTDSGNGNGNGTTDGGSGTDGATTSGGDDGSTGGSTDSGGSSDTGSLPPDAVTSDAAPTETSTPDGGSSMWPVMTNQGGSALAGMKLVTIVAGNDGDKDALFAFGDAVGASAWWSSFSSDFGLGAFGGHLKWTGPNITTASISDADMIAYIRNQITTNGLSAPDPNTLYLLYLPDGTNSSDSTTGEVNTNCKSSSGYHTKAGTDLIWGVVERCPSSSGWTKLQGVTQTAAHEIAETATDPNLDAWFVTCDKSKKPWQCSPFATATQGEVGDLCSDTRWDEASYIWTRVWSKAAAAAGGDPCVPALPGVGYQVVTEPTGWYTGSAGANVTIALTGWSSTGTSPTWNISTFVSKSSVTTGTKYTASLAASTIDVGASTNLTVAVPADATSGSWAVIEIDSTPVTLGTNDPSHPWYVGVYVP